MADSNVVDQYCFEVNDSANLCVHYEGAGASGDLQFSMGTLESSRSHIVLSQGYAVSSDSPPRDLPRLITKELPPFLLSREVFVSLKRDGKPEFKFEWSNEVGTVSNNKTTQLAIVVAGNRVKVPVVHCLGSLRECQLWIIDDANWPIILKHEEQDGYYWKLLETT